MPVPVKVTLILVLMVFECFSQNRFLNLSTKERNVFVLVGYLDNLESNYKIQSYFFDLKLSDQITEAVFRIFMSKNFTIEKHGYLTLFKNDESNSKYYYFNVNTMCGEDRYDFETGLFRRRKTGRLCADQVKLINMARSILENELTNFDEFIYIGHARLGNGLALGPFERDSTFSILHKSFNDPSQDTFSGNTVQTSSALLWGHSRLKSIKLFSCKSNYYYRSYIENLGIRFLGFDDNLVWHKIDPEQNTLLKRLEESLVE